MELLPISTMATEPVDIGPRNTRNDAKGRIRFRLQAPPHPHPPSRVNSELEIKRRNQQDEFALETGFREARLNPGHPAYEERFVQLRYLLGHTHHALRTQRGDNFIHRLVNAVTALVQGERVGEIAVFIEEGNPRG